MFWKIRKNSGIMSCFSSLLILLFLVVFISAETHNHLSKHIHQHPYLQDHLNIIQEINELNNCLSQTYSCHSVTAYYDYYSADKKVIKSDSCNNTCSVCRLKILLGFNTVEISHSCYPDLSLAGSITAPFTHLPQGLKIPHPPSRAPPSA